MMNKRIIYCPEELPKKDNYWVFLMGPIQGAPNWQQEVFDKFPEDIPVTFLSPRRKNNPVGSEDLKQVFSDEEYRKQVEWETLGLRTCDCILCWFPLPAEEIPGRSYAQTTRFELGENLARGKRIICGYDPKIPGNRYFLNKISTYQQTAPGNTLDYLLSVLKSYVHMSKEDSYEREWFTSDTHFSQHRTLTLSNRPFRNTIEMDWVIIENWNREVGPWDKIYHLGDFGNHEKVKYLNGIKTLLMGNYERQELKENGLENASEAEQCKYFLDKGWDEVFPDRFIDISLPRRMIPLEYPRMDLIVGHEPIDVKNHVDLFKELGEENVFGLFGHIHGRQGIKPWGMDIGVDFNHFSPVSLEKVFFIYSAIKKGYYDDNVWC